MADLHFMYIASRESVHGTRCARTNIALQSHEWSVRIFMVDPILQNPGVSSAEYNAGNRSSYNL